MSLPGIRFRTRLPRLALSMFLGTVLATGASASPPPRDYEVKAAFLLNFTKYVEWPASSFAAPASPLTICILGDDPFGRVIDQIVEGESVGGHKIAVERLQLDQQKSCQVIYTAAHSAPPALSLASPGVLTVGEGDDFLQRGGVIAFVLDNHHVRFDINLRTATNSGLRLSSKLLSVARSVER